MKEKADKINELCSRLALLERQLQQIHKKDEQAIKSEIELLIDTYDTFIVDSGVTELKRLKNSVMMSRNHLLMIIKDSPEAILVIDK
jgi:hypothetical protein